MPGKTSLAQQAGKPKAQVSSEPGQSMRTDALPASGGAPLPGPLRQKFEASTGADLSQVRVHTGADAHEDAQAVGARAFARGNDIHFAAGQYDPDSEAGQHLIAHEVAHTVQQQGGAPVQQNKLATTNPGDAHETEADHAADAMVTGSRAAITTGAPATIARSVFGDVYDKLTGKDKKPAPITSTATGSPAEAAKAGRPPTPSEYAGLDPDIVEKLWQSRKTYWALKDKKDEEFWDGVRAIPTADVFTLVQVVNGAKRLGLWGSIKIIKQIYTSSGSNGIKFEADGTPPMAAGMWGKDLQSFVRKEHGDEGTEVHTWYRQNSGAGNPGMHLGLDSGAGDTNLHWDPTNPMVAIGTGHPQLVDQGMFVIPTIYPVGQAIYSPTALAQHAIDIGKAGTTAQSALGKKTRSEKMLAMTLFLAGDCKVPEHARTYAQLEADDAHVVDHARADRVVGEVRRMVGIFDAIASGTRTLALQDESESGPKIDLVYTKFEEAQPLLWSALAALMQHLHAEVPGYASELAGFDKAEDWGPFAIANAEKQVRGLQAARAAKTK